MKEVYSEKGLGIYGISDVINNLKNGITDLIIVTDDIDLIYLEVTCKKCNNNTERIVNRDRLTETKQELISKGCSNCSSLDYSIKEKDFIDYLEELATLSGTRLEIISSKTEEGAQLQSRPL